MELMALLYDILDKTRKEGLMAIESDIEAPKESALFTKYPKVLEGPPPGRVHHRLPAPDGLRQPERARDRSLMDNEIETHHHEGEMPVARAAASSRDGLPAFGIVAAVMGVVHTMESVGLPPAELGILIAHALVGTFLGILLAYGFVAPLVGVLEQKLHEASKELECIKVTLLASLNDAVPTRRGRVRPQGAVLDRAARVRGARKHVKGAAKACSSPKPAKK